jgi:hypothetical protein
VRPERVNKWPNFIDFWICETGTGQQVVQLHDRYNDDDDDDELQGARGGWLRHCATSQKVAGSILQIFH